MLNSVWPSTRGRQSRNLSMIAAMLRVPPAPAEIVEAEQRLSDIDERASVAAADFAAVSGNFNRINLARPDGTPYPPIGERSEHMMVLHTERETLVRTRADAARRLVEARRNFAAEVSRQCEAGCAAVSEAILDCVDDIEELVGLISNLNLETAKCEVRVSHRVASRAPALLAAIRGIRLAVGGPGSEGGRAR